MNCQIELRNAGLSYPRTCALCAVGKPCIKRLDEAGLKRTIVELKAALVKAHDHFYECVNMLSDEDYYGPVNGITGNVVGHLEHYHKMQIKHLTSYADQITQTLERLK